MTYRSYQGFKLSPILVLIAVNFLLFVAIFVARVIDPQLAYKLVLLFGLTPAIFGDLPWTILTSMFTHAGLWHIFANMLTLFFFGNAVLRLVGTGRFLAVYFVGGVLGNIFYLFLGTHSVTAIGASGAVFALAGALVLMRPKMSVFVFPIPVPLPLWIAVIGIFVVLSIFGIRHILPIAWEAHLGGLILGLVAGYFFRKRERYFF